jgi:flagellar hook-associated protein 2
MNSTSGLYEADSARTYSINLSAGATLSNLRDAINDSDAGVTASIINGTGGAQLVLTGPEGANSIMRLSSSTTVDPDTLAETDDIAGFNYDPDVSTSQDMTQSVEAKDAAFTLNGIAATSHSNTVSDVLDGVTLELAGTNIGSATSLKITEDFSSKLTESLQAFVTAYNTAYSTMSSLGAYNTETQVAGALQGNSTLRLAMTQIRQNIFGTTSGNASSAYQTLSNIGVSISASGTLSIDTTKLNAAIKADSSTVTNLITNVGNAFDSTVDNLIDTDGSVTIATNGLNTTVKDLEKQQTKMQDRLDAIEARYRAQFSALDSLVASLTSTGDYLTSFISSLNSN